MGRFAVPAMTVIFFDSAMGQLQCARHCKIDHSYIVIDSVGSYRSTHRSHHLHMPHAYLLDISLVGISTSDVAIFCPQQVQKRCLFRIADLVAGLFLTKDPKKNHSDPWQDITFEHDTIDVRHITYSASECFRSICTAKAYMLSLRLCFSTLGTSESSKVMWANDFKGDMPGTPGTASQVANDLWFIMALFSHPSAWRETEKNSSMNVGGKNPHLINQCLFHSKGTTKKW